MVIILGTISAPSSIARSHTIENICATIDSSLYCLWCHAEKLKFYWILRALLRTHDLPRPQSTHFRFFSRLVNSGFVAQQALRKCSCHDRDSPSTLDPPPMIEFLELHTCSVRIKGRHALKWGTCSNSNTEQQYSIQC